ncbi:carboxymuconolactone decarboxylase family protein [Phytomonospora sp. NPDC050363]|uniref:carboxymuconolactone decarboxylase family protein n=1 Tax=Phytomonospora sp. NPDC050363 TaxID=3155642 RepID=UPI0033DA7844
MEPRLDLIGTPERAKIAKYLQSAGQAITALKLPPVTQELVSLRTSQINGCGVCVDMHTKEAVHAGETHERLHMVAVWRESKVFTDAERAALAFAEQAARFADGDAGVSDDVWADAAEHYDEDQLAALVYLVSFMSTANRMNVIVRNAGGDYQVGQFG